MAILTQKTLNVPNLEYVKSITAVHDKENNESRLKITTSTGELIITIPRGGGDSSSSDEDLLYITSIKVKDSDYGQTLELLFNNGYKTNVTLESNVGKIKNKGITTDEHINSCTTLKDVLDTIANKVWYTPITLTSSSCTKEPNLTIYEIGQNVKLTFGCKFSKEIQKLTIKEDNGYASECNLNGALDAKTGVYTLSKNGVSMSSNGTKTFTITGTEKADSAVSNPATASVKYSIVYGFNFYRGLSKKDLTTVAISNELDLTNAGLIKNTASSWVTQDVTITGTPTETRYYYIVAPFELLIKSVGTEVSITPVKKEITINNLRTTIYIHKMPQVYKSNITVSVSKK